MSLRMKLNMKRAVVLFFLISTLLATAAPAPRTVYVMPMAHGMDQYIANSLTNTRTLQVTTEPSKADLVLTDRVDADLDEFLDYNKPRPRRTSEPPSAVGQGQNDHTMMPDMLNAVIAVPSPGRISSLTRPKGTLFLVDATSRQIVWSTFETTKNQNPKQLARLAQRVVERLKNELPPRQ